MKMYFNIKRIRDEREINLRDLEKLSGISKSQISRIENNLSDPKLSVIVKIANALNVKLSELVTIKKIDK